MIPAWPGITHLLYTVTQLTNLSTASPTGLVTNARVTHATPAGLYAKTAFRDWECDTEVNTDGGAGCKDIARQLVEDTPGRDINVSKRFTVCLTFLYPVHI